MIATVEEVSLPRRALVPASWVRLMALGVALVAAFLMAGQTYWEMLDHGHQLWRLFLWKFACWGAWLVAAPWVLEGGASFERGGSRLRRLLAHVPASAGLALAGVVLASMVALWLQPFEPRGTYELSSWLRRNFTPWFYVGLIVYWVLIVAGYGLAAYRRARHLEVRESRLEAELARAQLEALRLEIQPHFLFNTLNSIAALVRRRANDRALEMLLGLAELLRATLERADRQLVPLGTELDLVERYVDLQRARFGDRLAVEFAVADECRELAVPALLLQPLVENAIRHGLSQRAAPGTLSIGADRGEDALVLTVSDDGVGLPADFVVGRDAGIGLTNTRSRLEQLYGKKAGLELTGRSGGGTRVEVRLPVEMTRDTMARSAAG